MLQDSRIHPNISANDALNGTFNYNTTPLAPVGCKVVAHTKLDKRKTYDPANMDGFNIRPCMEHYRCHIIILERLEDSEYVTLSISSLKLQNYPQKLYNNKSKVNCLSSLKFAHKPWTNIPNL